MHKRAFRGLIRTFIHVSCLSPPYFDKKPITLSNVFFKSKYGGGRLETCINVRFGA